MATKIQFRRGTTAQWTAANTLLAEGELGYDTDLKKFKIGDGTTTWNALSFFESGSSGAVDIQNDSDWIVTNFKSIVDFDSDLNVLSQADSDLAIRVAVLEGSTAGTVDIKADSDWIATNFTLKVDADSDKRILRETDSDLAVRVAALESGGVDIQADSDWVLRQFKANTMTRYVDGGGIDSEGNDGKRISKPFKTIQHAINQSGQGDSVSILNGRYAESLAITSADRNLVITGVTGGHSGGSVIQVDSITATAQTGLKLSSFRVLNISSIDNTDGSATATNIGNHYHEMLFSSFLNLSGTGFHEARDTKFASIQMSGSGSKYIYNCEIEGNITAANSAGSVTFIQGATSGAVSVSGAGSFFAMKDCSSLASGAAINIGAGVVYQLNNLTGYNITINAGAISVEQFLLSQGQSTNQAENFSTTYFEQIKIGLLKQNDRPSSKYLVVDSDNNVRWDTIDVTGAGGFSGTSTAMVYVDDVIVENYQTLAATTTTFTVQPTDATKQMYFWDSGVNSDITLQNFTNAQQSVGQAITYQFVVQQGATARKINTAVNCWNQGSTNILWAGNLQPSGVANALDVWSITVFRIGTGVGPTNWKMVGSKTQFGG